MKERLASLDILRGADMFLLLALGPVVRSICKLYPDGTAWLLIGDVEGKGNLRPVMIPFSELEKSSDDHRLTLE